MVNKKQFYNQLELVFWDIAIHTLSESKVVRNIIKSSCYISRNLPLIQKKKTIVVGLSAGLLGSAVFSFLALNIH
jgi:hypothetical protein